MEAKFWGKNQYVYGPMVPEVKAVVKKSLEWNLEDWKWDEDLFTASPLNSVPPGFRADLESSFWLGRKQGIAATEQSLGRGGCDHRRCCFHFRAEKLSLRRCVVEFRAPSK
ncbi:hypothetical protein K1719_008008 [Acacia pycnantha]|nr:hypothetical protein K1719_008008 [Acacia pycnantha]